MPNIAINKANNDVVVDQGNNMQFNDDEQFKKDDNEEQKQTD